MSEPIDTSPLDAPGGIDLRRAVMAAFWVADAEHAARAQGLPLQVAATLAIAHRCGFEETGFALTTREQMLVEQANEMRRSLAGGGGAT